MHSFMFPEVVQGIKNRCDFFVKRSHLSLDYGVKSDGKKWPHTNRLTLPVCVPHFVDYGNFPGGFSGQRKEMMQPTRSLVGRIELESSELNFFPDIVLARLKIHNKFGPS